MDGETHFLIRHGYAVLFLGVLADQLAIPIPTIPLLLAAGALVGAGQLSLVTTLAVALSASLVGDATFYGLGRRYGKKFLSFLCRMTLQRGKCVDRAESFAKRYGVWGLLGQRWLPGLATIMSPSSASRGCHFFGSSSLTRLGRQAGWGCSSASVIPNSVI
jgi:membrane protein DedA with SNARE-associated domain